MSKVLIGTVNSFLRIITGASVFQTFDGHQLALKFASGLATTRLLLKSYLVKIRCTYSCAGEYDPNTCCGILKELIKLHFIKVLEGKHTLQTFKIICHVYLSNVSM